MDQITTAIYENGVLRPAVSLDLPEHSEVEITIHTNGDSLDDKVGRALEAAGLSTPREIIKSPISENDSFREKVRKALGLHRMEYKYDAEPLSEARRAELAELFSGASEYIREDRDSRDESI